MGTNWNKFSHLFFPAVLIRHNGSKFFSYPTNNASEHLVTGSPNARAGVRIVEKTLEEPNFSLCH